MQRRWRPWTALAVALTLLAIGCGGFWWTCLRSDFRATGMRVSYGYGGTPWAVTFVVMDETGAPVPGVVVATQSHSGWTQDAITDPAGRAAVMPGEREVLAVRVGGQEVRFRPQETLVEMFFSPDSNGLVVKVILRR